MKQVTNYPTLRAIGKPQQAKAKCSLFKSESESIFNVEHVNAEVPSFVEIRKKKKKGKQNLEGFTSQIIDNQARWNPYQRDHVQAWNLPKLDDFEIGEFLGRGASCTAHVARHKDSGSCYCMKTIKRQKIENNLNTFIKTLKIEMYMNHPNIAKTYGIIVEKDKIYIVMELCVDGNLSSNLKDLKKQEVSCKNVLKEVIRGLNYLHDHQVQHRDLKLENILLSFGLAKISDFDVAVYNKSAHRRTTIIGSPLYFSPEMIAKNSYAKEADIWSLGIVAYELLCGYFPFNIDRYQEIKEIAEKEIEYPESLPLPARDLITRILVKDPESRLTLRQIITHTYLKYKDQDPTF